MFNTKTKQHEEQIKLLSELNSQQVNIINDLIKTYSDIVAHIKSLTSRVNDLELQISGLMQLTLTNHPKTKGKKKKVSREKEVQAYVELPREVNENGERD